MTTQQVRERKLWLLATVILLAISIAGAMFAVAPKAHADSLKGQDLVALAHPDPWEITGPDGIKYKIHFDGGSKPTSVFITGYTGNATHLTIPTSFVHEGVTISLEGSSIMIEPDAFKGNTSLHTLILGPEVETIGEMAFSECTSLETVVIAGTGKTIESYEALTFGENAFAGCSSLKSFYFGNKISEGTVVGLDRASIGQNSYAGGSTYEGVTVYTVKGSPVDEYIKATVNTKEGNTTKPIKLEYSTDPYADGVKAVTPAPDPTPTPTPSTDPDSGSSSSSSSKDSGSKDSGSKDSKSDSGSSSSSSPSDPSKDTPTNPSKTTKPETPYSSGSTADEVDAALVKYNSETDPKGTSFSLLRANVKKVSKKSITLKWSKAQSAKKYIVYGNKCGKNNKMVKLKTTTKSSIVFKKVNKKAVKKGKYYKFVVVALDKNNKVISTSKIVHAATKGGKYGNDKMVKTAAKKNKVSVKVNKTFKLKGKEVPESKKLKVSRHRKVAYESSDTSVATVSSKGVIKGLKKGSCNIYAYAQNGVFAKIKVTVK